MIIIVLLIMLVPFITLQKRESERKDIEARCSDGATRGDTKTAENVLNVEKIVLDNEKKIKDFKVCNVLKIYDPNSPGL